MLLLFNPLFEILLDYIVICMTTSILCITVFSVCIISWLFLLTTLDLIRDSFYFNKYLLFFSAILYYLGLPVLFLGGLVLYYVVFDIALLYSTLKTASMELHPFTTNLLSYNQWDLDPMLSGLPITAAFVAEPHDLYIPWNYTLALSKGAVSLNNMYNFLEDNSTLKQFINENCKFLLKPLEGHTGILKEALSINSLCNNPDTQVLGPTMSNYYCKPFQYKIGVYVFFEPDNNIVSQCGSSINFNSRLELHYHDFKSSSKPFYEYTRAKGDMSIYSWTPIFYLEDWVHTYKSTYGNMSGEHEAILRFYSQQYIRSVEQAITTYTSPQFGNVVDVNTWHNNWQPGYQAPASTGYPTAWTNLSGEVFHESSMKKAAHMLQLDIRSVERAANVLEPYVINSPAYGKVTITIEGKPIKDFYDASYNKDPLLIPELSELKPNLYYIYNTNMSSLDIGPFNSIREVNDALGVNHDRQNLRWVNIDHRIYAPLLGCSVYIICNKITAEGIATDKKDASMKVRVINITTGEDLIFSSMSKASIHIFGAKRGMDKIIRAYVITNKTYTYRGIQYNISYVNPNNLIAAKAKYGN